MYFNTPATFTDLYQITMMYGYWKNGKQFEPSAYDLFIRKFPKGWGYMLAGGIGEALSYLENFRFTEEQIAYLKTLPVFSHVEKKFWTFIKDFKFTGSVYGLREGTPFFPLEPVITVEAERYQAQMVESTLLNIINYQTMVMTKASRLCHASRGKPIVEMGLRRAATQTAAMSASRASYIGGCVATSNVEAGRLYDIPIKGTMAHAFVTSFKTELESFRAWVKAFPNDTILLIDTYNTREGAKNAVTVAKELAQVGKHLGGVRIDSGDLANDAEFCSLLFSANDLHDLKILLSGDLDEKDLWKLSDLPYCNFFGVGTKLVVAEGAINGVYKLVWDVDGGKMKLSSGKRNYPARKAIWRNESYCDTMALMDEVVKGSKWINDMLMVDGEDRTKGEGVEVTRARCQKELAQLPSWLKNVSDREDETVNEVQITKNLADMTMRVSENILKGQ